MDFNQELTKALPILKRYGMVLCRSMDQAEDLVNQTVLRALEKKDHYKEEGGRFLGWITVVMYRQHINNIRRQSKHKEAMSSVSALTQKVFLPNQENNIRYNDAVSAFRSLEPRKQQVLELIGIEKMSYDEAAMFVGVPVGTIRSRLSRGRRELRSIVYE